MTFGAEIWGPPLINAGASLISGWFSGKGNASKETKTQKTKRKLVDKLLMSLNGEGPYSDLYSFDQDIFNKSFVEPAKAKFRNEIAPNIQQQYIAHGQQRGTGLDDTLTRAGVDLDNMLNQYMYNAQQDVLNRKQNTINSILGGGEGAQRDTSSTQDLFSSASGFLNSDAFRDFSKDLFKDKTQQPQKSYRKGFAAD